MSDYKRSLLKNPWQSSWPVDDVGSWHETWRKQTSEVDEEGTSQETTLFGVLSLRADTAIINRLIQGSSKLPPSYMTAVQSASCLNQTEYFQKGMENLLFYTSFVKRKPRTKPGPNYQSSGLALCHVKPSIAQREG